MDCTVRFVLVFFFLGICVVKKIAIVGETEMYGYDLCCSIQ